MPDGWGQSLMYEASDDRPPSTADLLLASGDDRVGVLAFGPRPGNRSASHLGDRQASPVSGSVWRRSPKPP